MLDVPTSPRAQLWLLKAAKRFAVAAALQLEPGHSALWIVQLMTDPLLPAHRLYRLCSIGRCLKLCACCQAEDRLTGAAMRREPETGPSLGTSLRVEPTVHSLTGMQGPCLRQDNIQQPGH